MKKRDPLKSLPWILAAMLCLFPFVALVFFAYPSADDYSMAVLVRQLGRAAYMKAMYLEWTGRYTANLAEGFHPLTLGSLWIYRAVILAVMIVMYHALSVFVLAVTGHRKLRYPAALALFVVYLNIVPSTAESIYWFPGAVEYSLACAGLLYVFSMLVRTADTSRPRPLRLILILLIIVACCGLNEVAALLMLELLLLLNLWNFVTRRRLSPEAAAALVTALLATTAAVAAPGNFARMSVFDQHMQVIPALWGAAVATAKLAVVCLQSPLTIIFTLIVMLAVAGGKITLPLKVSGKMLSGAAVLFMILLYSLYLPPLLATGMQPALRVHGAIAMFFLCGWFTLAMMAGALLKKQRSLHVPRLLFSLLFVSALVLTAGDFRKEPAGAFQVRSNVVRAWSDLLLRAGDYREQMKTRDELLIYADRSGCRSLLLPPLTNPPESVSFIDLSADSTDWKNVNFAAWHGIPYVRITDRKTGSDE